MRLAPVLVVLQLLFYPWLASGEEYRRLIDIFVENRSALPNRVQVRDVEARASLPEDCRIAKKVANLCGGRKGEFSPSRRDAAMTCATALALLEEPRCQIKDLIFDDWIDGGMNVKLTIHTGVDGFGFIAVRAINNTESWTFKPGLRDGDTVGHQ